MKEQQVTLFAAGGNSVAPAARAGNSAGSGLGEDRAVLQERGNGSPGAGSAPGTPDLKRSRSEMARHLLVLRREDYTEDSVSAVLRFLTDKGGYTLREVAERTGIAVSTLYSISSRRSNRVDVRLLKKLADFFGEDVEIFCGLDSYQRKRVLSDREARILDAFGRLTPSAQARLEGSLEDMLENPRNIKSR